MAEEVELVAPEQHEQGPPPPPFRIFPFTGHTKPIFLICLLSLAFYWKTLENEYALDDGIVVMQNEYVLKGFEGIPSLLKEDYFHSFYRRMNASDQLSGGRYRPLPVITFAVEQEILGVYRTGYYEQTEDLNKNGILDDKPVLFTNSKGETQYAYEYNNYSDLNRDGVAQPNECNRCWDTNGNFHEDPDEDLNRDGVLNEVDCQVYGSSLRHFNNVILFMFCCVALYLFLSKQLLPQRPDLAFLTSLVFLIHPVHSEVVANVKGREDLLCFLFMVLCLGQALVFARKQRPHNLVLSIFSGFLALMSKETAVVLLVLVPLTFYFGDVPLPGWKRLVPAYLAFLVCVFVMTKFNINHTKTIVAPWLMYLSQASVFGALIILSFPFINTPPMLLIVAFLETSLIYYALRLNAVTLAPILPGGELLNDPYLLATGHEKFATMVFVLLKYLGLVLFPHPLVSDYSYNSIPYVSLTNPGFILSVVVHLGLLACGIWLTIKKHIAGYGILIYLLFILIGSNLLFDTHLVMLEAYLFHAVLGAALVVAWFLLKAVDGLSRQKAATARPILYSMIAVLIIFCGIKAWERSADWKNDITLFLKDVKQAPNSVIVLGNAAARWIDLADTKEITGALGYAETTSGPDSYGDEDPPYATYNDYNGQLKIDDEEWRNTGYANKREAAIYRGINYLKRAVTLHPRYVNGYLNLGLAYYKLGKFDSTILYWKMAQFYYPENPYLANYYHVYKNELLNKSSDARTYRQFDEALTLAKRVFVIFPDDKDAWMSMAATYYNMNNRKEARRLLQYIVKKHPYEQDARVLLERIGS